MKIRIISVIRLNIPFAEFSSTSKIYWELKEIQDSVQKCDLKKILEEGQWTLLGLVICIKILIEEPQMRF